MQNPIKNRQSPAVFKKPGTSSRTLTSLNYRRVKYFLLNSCTRFLLINVYKSVFETFFILFRSWIICKNLKCLGFYTLTEIIFINSSRSKQHKKTPNILLQTLLSRKRVQISAKKLSNSMLDGARRSFQFFREITWFLRNNRALPKFRYQILHLWWPKAPKLTLKKIK